jgi:hypothetical protein
MSDENKDWNVLEWKVDGESYKVECEGEHFKLPQNLGQVHYFYYRPRNLFVY